MRVAFAAQPALGHVLPLFPLALTAHHAGHDVLVLTGASVEDAVTGVGLRFVEAGPRDLWAAFEQVPERAGLSGRRLAALTWRRAFAGVIAPQMAASLLARALTGSCALREPGGGCETRRQAFAARSLRQCWTVSPSIRRSARRGRTRGPDLDANESSRVRFRS